MNTKHLIVMVLIFLLTLSVQGCESAPRKVEPEQVMVMPFCNDSVVCYFVKYGYGASGSCFRDEDLVKKYCNDATYTVVG